MATIRDVACRAGVAPSIVSYALSGKRSISDAARTRIAQAIEDLDLPLVPCQGEELGLRFRVCCEICVNLKRLYPKIET